MTQPFSSLPPAQRAGILCNDPRFQKYAAHRCGVTGQSFNNSAAAQYLCNECNVTSRRDLNAGGHALDRFNALRTEVRRLDRQNRNPTLYARRAPRHRLITTGHNPPPPWLAAATHRAKVT